MTRISIDVTDDDHKKLKAIATLRGQSIKDYVLERTLGGERDDDDAVLKELEKLLDGRIRSALGGKVSRRNASGIFAEAVRKKTK